MPGLEGLGAPGLAPCSLHHVAGLRALALEAAVVRASMVTVDGCVGLKAVSVTSFILTPARGSRHCPHGIEGSRI